MALATLTNADQLLVRSRWTGDDPGPVALQKSDLLAALQATDTWIGSNQAAYAAALPLTAQTALTTKQKVRLFLYVLQRRFDIS